MGVKGGAVGGRGGEGLWLVVGAVGVRLRAVAGRVGAVSGRGGAVGVKGGAVGGKGGAVGGRGGEGLWVVGGGSGGL